MKIPMCDLRMERSVQADLEIKTQLNLSVSAILDVNILAQSHSGGLFVCWLVA